MDLDKLGGRRFLLTFGTMLATTLLCWFTKVSGEVYATVTIATVGALIAGNTTQHIKNIVK
jgi:hypothetical protein